MKQKRIALSAVLALLLVLLAGCGGKNAQSSGGGAGDAAPVQTENPPQDTGDANHPDSTDTRLEDQRSQAGQPEDWEDPQDSPEENQGSPELQPPDPGASGSQPEERQPPSPGPEEGPREAGPSSEPDSEPEPAPDPAEALEDGVYTASVTLEGGSGRASVESPAQLRCENGQFWATILWSSPNFDYMKVDGERYDPVNTEGNSVFEIPVATFDQKLPVIADTVAMSEPHEVEYTLQFDSTTLQKQ